MDNFIKLYDKAITKEMCKYFIDFFNSQKKRGNTYNPRTKSIPGWNPSSVKAKLEIKDSEDLCLKMGSSWMPKKELKAYHSSKHIKMLKDFDNIIDNLFTEYIFHYFGGVENVYQLRKERNLPLFEQDEKWYHGQPLMHCYEPPHQGYYKFHPDWGPQIGLLSKRMLVGMAYLNDVHIGGETEFFHQKVSIQPTEGTVVVWPAYFTHLHKGHPPISNTKYILNKWCMPIY